MVGWLAAYVSSINWPVFTWHEGSMPRTADCHCPHRTALPTAYCLMSALLTACCLPQSTDGALHYSQLTTRNSQLKTARLRDYLICVTGYTHVETLFGDVGNISFNFCNAFLKAFRLMFELKSRRQAENL